MKAGVRSGQGCGGAVLVGAWDNQPLPGTPRWERKELPGGERKFELLSGEGTALSFSCFASKRPFSAIFQFMGVVWKVGLVFIHVQGPFQSRPHPEARGCMVEVFQEELQES